MEILFNKSFSKQAPATTSLRGVLSSQIKKKKSTNFFIQGLQSKSLPKSDLQESAQSTMSPNQKNSRGPSTLTNFTKIASLLSGSSHS